jgi:predicted SnoaL-like aldol condensation-catalyzing enzyme
MSDLKTNKDIVIDFYQSAFDGAPEEAVASHVGHRYIQHNPHTEDGTAPFIAYVSQLRASHSAVHVAIKRVLADGDLVMTHSGAASVGFVACTSRLVRQVHC